MRWSLRWQPYWELDATDVAWQVGLDWGIDPEAEDQVDSGSMEGWWQTTWSPLGRKRSLGYCLRLASMVRAAQVGERTATDEVQCLVFAVAAVATARLLERRPLLQLQDPS